ncbi:MAG: hypothetical protein U1E52_13595 [Geminicoccaceae bacterium]
MRQFERETQSRFRALEEPGSVWEGLALDLVGSRESVGEGRLLALPRPSSMPSFAQRAPQRAFPPHSAVRSRPDDRGRRTFASRLVGVLLVAMAIGAVYQFVRGERDQASAAWKATAFHDRRLAAAPDLTTTDRSRAGEWLATELGQPVPAVPLPTGYRLVGVSRVQADGNPTGAAIYESGERGGGRVVLFVRPAESSPAEVDIRAATKDFQEVTWDVDGLSYSAVGTVPEDQLRRFAH